MPLTRPEGFSAPAAQGASEQKASSVSEGAALNGEAWKVSAGTEPVVATPPTTTESPVTTEAPAAVEELHPLDKDGHTGHDHDMTTVAPAKEESVPSATEKSEAPAPATSTESVTSPFATSETAAVPASPEPENTSPQSETATPVLASPEPEKPLPQDEAHPVESPFIQKSEVSDQTPEEKGANVVDLQQKAKEKLQGIDEEITTLKQDVENMKQQITTKEAKIAELETSKPHLKIVAEADPQTVKAILALHEAAKAS